MTRPTIRRWLPTLLAATLLLLLPLLLFAPVALGSRTLLPADALFLFEPYRSAADELGVGVPQNALLGDLILENYAWKRFLLEAIRNRELPLWDPLIFAGHPFLANGQHSALYPLSLVFYVLPLWRAYGVFTWLQLGLAGWWAYLLARTLGVRRWAALISGITFQLSGFMLVSVVHPMIIAGASWLPFILAMVERVIRQHPALGGRPASLPWALLGAVGLGCQMLAGHAENTYLVLLVTAAYAAWRLVTEWLANRRPPLRSVAWLALLAALGLTLGAVQFVPLYETAASSFRAGEAAASLEQVLQWAYPIRRLIAFAVPNFFGNPAHHTYFDLFQWRTVPFTTNAAGQPINSPYWDVKNYVEGGAYLGLLPVLLAAVAVWEAVTGSRRRTTDDGPRTTDHGPRTTDRGPRTADRGPRTTDHVTRLSALFFTLLSLFSLGCIFGTPLYALVYALPLLQQSHAPFRWVFPLTLAVAMLAGFGAETVQRGRFPRAVRWLAALSLWGGLATLTLLLLSRLFFAQIAPLVERAFQSLSMASDAFPDARAFYSYEFRWVALFGLLLCGTGVVLSLTRARLTLRHRPIWEFLALALLVADLVAFGAGFNPAVDPALLDYTPPVVSFLQQQPGPWRYAVFTPPGTTRTMNPNVGMFYGLQDVAGYDSLFSRQYADYMRLIEPQNELPFNRIAPFSQWSSLDSPLTDLLNVRYIITEVEIPNPARYRLVYQDEAVRVYENLAALPRAFTLPITATVATEAVADALLTYDPHQYVIVLPAAGGNLPTVPQAASWTPQAVVAYTGNQVIIEASVDTPSWLVLTDAYFTGWRAFVRPAGEEAEQEVSIALVDGNFRGVRLEAGRWVVRFKYSPNSVKIGAFLSFIAGMTSLFLTGLYLWRFFYRQEDDATTVRRVAKNSIAPILLNLLNRGMDMALYALAARILGPTGSGRYDTATAIFGWFDILTNFGLNMYLLREASRQRERAGRLFVATTALRLLLVVGWVPLLALFLLGRQSLAEPLASDAVRALLLLYIGLVPGTVAMGVGALFQAFEKHEVPAAIQTVTTLIKVTLCVLALVGGLGIVGLAGASILTNIATLAILLWLARRLLFPGERRLSLRVDWQVLRGMAGESWPLMVVHLLQSIFFKVDVVLLQALRGDAMVGWYTAAHRWIDGLQIIPSFFTFAVFPVISRQAVEDRAALLRSYRLAIKLLVLTAIPAALTCTLLARVLVGVLSGAQFLPHGAIALQITVWSILIGWINSLTNYVLIALNRQRQVALALGLAAAFNITFNLVLIPRFGYTAAAVALILSEGVLLSGTSYFLRRDLGPIGWGRTLGRLAIAGLVAGAVAAVLVPSSALLALVAGLVAYLAAIPLLRVFTPEEREMLAPLLPSRLRRFVA